MNFNKGDRVIWSVPSKNMGKEYNGFMYTPYAIGQFRGRELCGTIKYQATDNNWGRYPDGRYIHPFYIEFDICFSQYVLPEQLRYEKDFRFDAQFVEDFLSEVLKGGAIK